MPSSSIEHRRIMIPHSIESRDDSIAAEFGEQECGNVVPKFDRPLEVGCHRVDRLGSFDPRPGLRRRQERDLGAGTVRQRTLDSRAEQVVGQGLGRIGMRETLDECQRVGNEQRPQFVRTYGRGK